MRLPDFIVAGAPRGGTTWLYELLNRHPGIHVAKPVKPEPKFFLIDEIYAKGLEYYSQTWFSGIDSALVAGEKSSNYLESSQAAIRIRECVPSVKLVFILRDPADRAISNYRWSVMNGIETETLARALDLECDRTSAVSSEFEISRPFAYYSRGLYADLLAPYFEAFPRSQILCLQYEHIQSQPEHLAERLHTFLGVPPRPGDARGLGVINSSSPLEVPGVRQVRPQLARRYAEPNSRLVALLGPDFDVWSST